MRPREASIQDRVVGRLRTARFRVVKLHGGAFLSGWPDLLALRGGRACFVEVKRPGEGPAPLQRAIMRDLSSFGALCLWGWDVEEIVRLASEHCPPGPAGRVIACCGDAEVER